MKLCFRIVFLLLLVAETLAQDLFDLSEALDPTPPKLKEQPKTPEKSKNDGGLDLFAALVRDGFGLDLEDGLGPDPYHKPVVKSPSGGGGLDLSAVLADVDPTPPKPKEQPETPEKSKNDDFQEKVIQKLDTIDMEVKQILRLLPQIMAQSSSK